MILKGRPCPCCMRTDSDVLYVLHTGHTQSTHCGGERGVFALFRCWVSRWQVHKFVSAPYRQSVGHRDAAAGTHDHCCTCVGCTANPPSTEQKPLCEVTGGRDCGWLVRRATASTSEMRGQVGPKTDQSDSLDSSSLETVLVAIAGNSTRALEPRVL